MPLRGFSSRRYLHKFPYVSPILAELGPQLTVGLLQTGSASLAYQSFGLHRLSSI